MTAIVPTHPRRPAASRWHHAAPPRRRAEPSHAPRRRVRATLEALESRMLLSAAGGVFDTGFGIGGKVRLDIDGLADRAEWVGALPDGKVLVFGTSTHGVTVQPPSGSDPAAQPSVRNLSERFLARLRADGSLDPAFGDAGVLRLNDPDGDLNPPLVQPDGKILIAGCLTTSDANSVTLTGNGADAIPTGGDRTFVLGRFDADGTLDEGFGDHGVATLDLFAGASAISDERTASLAVQPDGKIVAVGVAEKTVRIPGPRLSTIDVVRFNADGTWDEPFGRHVEDVAFKVQAVAVDRDGRIVVGASASQVDGLPAPALAAAGGFTLFRYNADGSEDLTFGQGGRAAIHAGPLGILSILPTLTDLLVLPDGKYAIAGIVGSANFVVARVDASGAPDASFDADGVVLGRGIRAEYLGAPAGQYRLRYDASDQSLGLTGVGTGSETQAGTPHATGLEVFSARIAADGRVVSAGRAVNLPMNGVEFAGAAAIGDGGRILAAGTAFPTADAGEGDAYAQTADALVVRLDPAALPAAIDPIALTYDAGGPSGSGNTPPGSTAGLHGSSGGTGGASEEPTVSNVTFAGRALVRGGRTYSFRIGYPTETLARQTPVTVTGPNAFASAAAVLKLKLTKTPHAAATAAAAAAPPAARPAVATYRVGAPGGAFDAADQGRYAVRLNAAAERVGSGQIVGIFSVSGKQRKAAPAASPLVKLEVVNWTGVLRSPSSLPGNFAGWLLDRDDAGGAGQLSDLDLSKVPGAAVSLLSGRRVAVTGTTRVVNRPGGGSFTIMEVESLTVAT